MCPKCFLSLDRCECAHYPNHAFAVDSELVDVISELNRRGYFTIGCCSGHSAGRVAQIRFVAKYSIELPKGWYWDMHYSMFYNLTDDESAFDTDKDNMLKGLNEWVKGLPVLADAFSEHSDPIIHENLNALLFRRAAIIESY